MIPKTFDGVSEGTLYPIVNLKKKGIPSLPVVWDSELIELTYIHLKVAIGLLAFRHYDIITLARRRQV